jgi:hypothetical protein
MTLRNLRLAVLLLALACTVGCDQTSKHLARVQLGKLGAVTLPGDSASLGWPKIQVHSSVSGRRFRNPCE